MSVDSEKTFRLVKETLDAWAQRDLEATLVHMHEEIEYFVNVDPEVAPFAASANGIAALKARLQLMLDTFIFDAFVVEDIKVTPGKPGALDVSRVAVAYFYRETTTRQRLDGRFRLIVYVDGDRIVRIEELHDSHYIEAFARLVKTMQSGGGQ